MGNIPNHISIPRRYKIYFLLKYVGPALENEKCFRFKRMFLKYF